MPPLLTLCHLHQFLCQATWDGSFASVVAPAPLFPWMPAVALLMVAGLIATLSGGVLLILATPRTEPSPIPATT
jgi:hypothetical protein